MQKKGTFGKLIESYHPRRRILNAPRSAKPANSHGDGSGVSVRTRLPAETPLPPRKMTKKRMGIIAHATLLVLFAPCSIRPRAITGTRPHRFSSAGNNEAGINCMDFENQNNTFRTEEGSRKARREFAISSPPACSLYGLI
jgi:hypothetical protein